LCESYRSKNVCAVSYVVILNRESRRVFFHVPEEIQVFQRCKRESSVEGNLVANLGVYRRLQIEQLIGVVDRNVCAKPHILARQRPKRYLLYSARKRCRHVNGGRQRV